MDEKKERSCGIYLALDGMNLADAGYLCRHVKDLIVGVKIHDLYDREGKPAVAKLKDSGVHKVWVDFKLHDIPGTVGKRGSVVARMDRSISVGDNRADIVTVHASGGVKMMMQAIEHGPDEIFAVTLLTSLSPEEVREIYHADPQTLVYRWATLAGKAGVHGIVCSALEVAMLREMREDPGHPIAASTKLIVPGTRSPGADKGDQKRSATPAKAVRDGADILVIGSEVTKAADPVAALNRIIKDISTFRSES
ncbi:MAG: orotidine-5'-phosphate decarboxylase [Patescibacteria group bacterium]|nr:orotidine-5'-phosphate decarboxylase [Patescibacteria group bacterium]